MGWINRKYFQGYYKGRKDITNKILRYLNQYDDNDLVKVKYLRQLLKGEDEDGENI